MNSSCSTILYVMVCAALALTARVLAATDTWDGGGADNNISTNNNWLDNTAPASDLVNTDIIFAGNVRLSPNASVPFSTNSIVFNNTAGAFNVVGNLLSVGAGGITNNDADTDTFANAVNFSGVANSTINAASGGLTYFNSVRLPSGQYTVVAPGS